jgi:hypothetical protein
MPSILCSHCGKRILLPTPVPVCSNCGTPFTVSGSSASAAGGSTASSHASPPTPLPPLPSAYSPKAGASSAAPVKAKTPRGSTSHAPDLEGIVAAPPHRDTIEKSSDWSQIVLQVLFFLFTLPFFIRNLFKVRGRSRSTMTVHTIRVWRSDGTSGEARFEGDFTASIPAPGDRVSLWGSSRAGILIVKRAYNHNTGAKIKTSGSSRLWLSRVAAIALPVLILALLYLYAPLIPSLLSALGTFLIMGLVIYFLVVIFVPWIPRRIVPYVVGIFLLYAILSVCTHMNAHPHP